MTATLSPVRATVADVHAKAPEDLKRIVTTATQLLEDVRSAGTDDVLDLLRYAASVTLILPQHPYASLAIEVHTACVTAIRMDLGQHGFAHAEAVVLAYELVTQIESVGLEYAGGQWWMDRKRRATVDEWNSSYPSTETLVFDVEGLIPDAEKEET